MSASIFFALKNERDMECICTQLQLSSGFARIPGISLLTLLISGVIRSFVSYGGGMVGFEYR